MMGFDGYKRKWSCIILTYSSHFSRTVKNYIFQDSLFTRRESNQVHTNMKRKC